MRKYFAPLVRAVAVALLASTAACGTIYKQVRPYPPHKPFYELEEFDRKVYYCLNEMRGAQGNLELGMYGKRYKSPEDMPLLDGEPSTVRNVIFKPILYAGALTVLGTSGYLLYRAKWDGDGNAEFEKDSSLVLTYLGIILGAGLTAAWADSMTDKIANQGQYNEWMGTQYGLAPDQRPKCDKLDDNLQRVILKTYKDLREGDQKKNAPVAPPPSAPAPAAPAPAVQPSAAATPTGA